MLRRIGVVAVADFASPFPGGATARPAHRAACGRAFSLSAARDRQPLGVRSHIGPARRALRGEPSEPVAMLPRARASPRSKAARPAAR